MNYVFAFKTEPDLCGISCPCNVILDTDVSEEDRRAIEDDALFERTADAATYHQGDGNG